MSNTDKQVKGRASLIGEAEIRICQYISVEQQEDAWLFLIAGSENTALS